MMQVIDIGVSMDVMSSAAAPLEALISETVPSTSDIREELQSVVASRAFDASDRNRRFLSYVVEETLAGRSERIKAYSIATAVFGRDVDFDPQLDPVVRMEAQRLRRSLERFYLIEGRTSAVRISLPKGAYVPEFHSMPPSAREANPTTRQGGYVPPILSILVRPFEIDGDGAEPQRREPGFSFQLMIELSRHPRLNVIDARYGPISYAADLSADLEADFILAGSKGIYGETMQAKAVVLDARTGKVLWGCSFQRIIDAEGPLKARDCLASSIAHALLKPGELDGL